MPEEPQPRHPAENLSPNPESNPRQDVEEIVAGLSSLDSARLTVRWALERIRFLESSNAEILELLRQTRLAREQTEKRYQGTLQKEKLIAEMQGMLNSLFKGEVDIQKLLEQREKLDALEKELEAKAGARMAEADEKANVAIKEYQRRAVELERTYKEALAETEARHREELQEMERRRQREALDQQAREARFQEQLQEEIQKHAEEYQQKTMLLQLEFSAKRKELQKDYEQLKVKLLEEATAAQATHSDAYRLAQMHWNAEKERLQGQLEEMERELNRQQEAFSAVEQSLRERELRRVQERDIRHQQELAAIEAKWEKELQSARENGIQALRAAREEYQAQGMRLQAQAEQKARAAVEALSKEFEENRLKQTAELSAHYRRELEALAAEYQKRAGAVESKLREELAARQKEIESLKEEIFRQSSTRAVELDRAEVRCAAAQEQAASAKEALENESQRLRAAECRVAELEKEKAAIEAKLREAEAAHEQDLQRVMEAAAEAQRRQLEAEEAKRKSAELETLRDLQRSEILSEAKRIEELEQTLAEEEKTHPSIPPAPRPAALRGWLLAAFSALLLGSAGVLFFCARMDPVREYAVPFSHPSGMAWAGDSLWVVDGDEKAVYRLKERGAGLELVMRIPVGDSHLTGLAAGDGELFVVDSASKQLQRRAMDATLTLLAAKEAPADAPSGLHYDGKHLWSADKAAHRLYQHDASSLEVLESYSLDEEAAALTTHGGKFWISDAQANRIHVRDLAPWPRLRESFSLAKLSERPIACLSMKEGRLWTGQEGRASLARWPRWWLLLQRLRAKA